MSQTAKNGLKFCSFLLLLFSFCAAASAQGNLLITPRRVVLDGKKRTEILNLANTGNDSAVYSISFVQIRMKEDGSFEEIKTPDSLQRFASNYIRVYPRTVVLAPNEAQTVKLQIQRATELTDGEYRSHLYFRAVPKERPLGQTDTRKDSSLSIQLVPIFGITVPVILQIGESNTKASISNLSLIDTSAAVAPILSLSFSRAGNMSVYGDLTIEHISPAGVVTKVGYVRGIAVYFPSVTRRFITNLERAKGVDFHKGIIRATYTDQSVRPVTLAQAETNLK